MQSAAAMMQRWGEDAVRFMRDASEYGTYYAELTAKLLPYLPEEGHICDAGCGLGYLAQEIAKHRDYVTAIDASQAAIAAMRQRCENDRLQIRCEDIFAEEEQFDAMIFCYFGKTDEILELSAKLCRGTVIVVKRDCSEHTFSLGKVVRKPHSVELLAQRLSDLQVKFELQRISLEMGQPFSCIEDALRFFRLYNKSEERVDEAAVRSRLVPTDHEVFPLYLPSVRNMELIIFDANELRTRLEKKTKNNA